MYRVVIFSLLILHVGISCHSQSLEIMPGTERVFADAQWLKTLDQERKWSLFSRSRATVDYNENTNLFSGAYLNYTSSSGFGGTLVGRISSGGAGSDLGVHFFKASRTLMIYALASLELSANFGASWFSIMRYTPELGEIWRLYSSLELFSNFGSEGHNASVQRLRAGLDRSGYQFGLGLNLAGFGNTYSMRDYNPGIFIRKQF